MAPILSRNLLATQHMVTIRTMLRADAQGVVESLEERGLLLKHNLCVGLGERISQQRPLERA